MAHPLQRFAYPAHVLALASVSRAERQGGRLLEVGVYDADIFLPIRQIVCQKDAERGLAYSALLIGENNNYVLLRFHDFTILLSIINVSLLF